MKVSDGVFDIWCAAATAGVGLYPMILADDAVQGQGNPLFTPGDCQEPSLFNKALVAGKVLICTYSYNYIYGGSTLQQLVTTIRTVKAAGVVLVVDGDSVGSKFDPVPLIVPAIVVTSYSDSTVCFIPSLFS